jgi:hypothetical protein
MNWEAWFQWTVDHPIAAATSAGAVALGVLLLIVVLRLLVAALGRRVLVGMGVRKKVERENPWATAQDRTAYGMRPPVSRRWYDLRGNRS